MCWLTINLVNVLYETRKITVTNDAVYDFFVTSKIKGTKDVALTLFDIRKKQLVMM